MSPRVLIVNKFLHHVGGVETYVKWLSTNLPGDDIELAFVGMPAPADATLMDLDGATYFTPSRDFHGSAAVKARSAAASVYSIGAAKALRSAVEAFRPDLVHFHATCFQLTSSVVRECGKLGLPAVATSHDHFLVCSNQRLWDDGRAAPCTKCVGQSVATRAANMVSTRCVKSSLGASVLGAAELPVSYGVWSSFDGLVHAPSQYMAGMLANEASPVSDRVRHLDLSWGPELSVAGEAPEAPTVTFFGRLSREKGVAVLVEGWPAVTSRIPDARLKIYGTGDQEVPMTERAARLTGVSFHGRFDMSDLPTILSGTTITVHPSECAENSPYTVRESLQAGIPAVVTDVGGMPELIGPETGAVAPRSDPARLADAIVAELSLARGRTDRFRTAVRARALTDQGHLDGLRAMYAEAARRSGRADVFG